MLRFLKLRRKKKGEDGKEKKKKKKKEKQKAVREEPETPKDGKERLDDVSGDEDLDTAALSVRMASGLPNYKVILCGEYGVGKSSIFRRFLNNTFIEENTKKSTIGLDQCTRPFTVGQSEVKLTLWDTGGMERMSFIGSSYYRGAHAALLCYNSNNKDTFTILSQYILDIVMNAEGAKIFLCGNDAKEVEGKEKVEEADQDVFMSECQDVLSGVYNVSCKDNWGMNEMFQDMARVLHQDAMQRATIRRDLIRPGETPEMGEEGAGKKRCC